MSGHANQPSEFMNKKNPSSKKEATAAPAPADQALAESEAANGDDNVQFSNEVIANKAGEITKEKQETTTVQAPETKTIDKQEATTVLKSEAKIEEKQAAKEAAKKPEEQKVIFEQRLKEYMGNEEQRDDIALLGLKIL